MLKPKSPQESFFGSYLYDRIVPVDHLLRKISQVVNFSFAGEILKDRYNPDIGQPAEDPEFLLRRKMNFRPSVYEGQWHLTRKEVLLLRDIFDAT